jgi:DNA-binding SARP family transcriptional activator
VRDGTGRSVHVGGRQLRVLLTLLALNAGRVVPAGSLAGQIWPDDPPGNPGNALQTLVSRLRAELRQAGICDVIESHPAGYRLAVPTDAVDVMAFEALAGRGRRALADRDAGEAARVLRDALVTWRGQPLADAAGCDFADAAAAKLTELRASALADRIEADLALGEGASLVGELRVLLSADPLAERPRALLMRALYAAGRQAEALAAYHEGRELLADQLGVDPSAQLEQVYLGILRGPHDLSPDTERAEVRAQAPVSAVPVQSPLTSFVGRDEDVPRVLKNLRAARLVTLTGPGGVGKTRLATAASRRLDVAAWFVPLAPVTDPAEVAYAVLDTLGIREPVIARRAAGPGAGPLDRLAAALRDRDEVMVLDNCDRYSRSEDPWVRAAAPLLRGTFGIMLGRTEGAESECQAALAAFRALGEAWGTAAVLMQLADFAKLRGDYAVAIAALEEAASLGQELGAWGDLSHIAGKLALVQLRAGDLTAARANLERAERGDSERSVAPYPDRS